MGLFDKPLIPIGPLSLRQPNPYMATASSTRTIDFSIPQQEYSFFDKFIKRSPNLNPKNWGVVDYTNKGDFNSAYSNARQSGEKQFMWNGERFNTKYDGTFDEQLRETGITDDQIIGNNKFSPTSFIRNRLSENLFPYGYEDPVPRLFNTVIRNKKEDFGDVKDSNKLEERVDAFNLYLGRPQNNNTFKESKYRPSKSSDDISYFSFDRMSNYVMGKLNKNIPLNNGEYDNVMGKYKEERGKDEHGDYVSYYDLWSLNPFRGVGSPDIPILRNFDDPAPIGKPFEIYDRVYYRENPSFDGSLVNEKDIYNTDEFKQIQEMIDGTSSWEELRTLLDKRNEIITKLTNKSQRYVRQYYSDVELMNINIDEKNFDTLALQRELSNRGIDLPKSRRGRDFDGVFGEETKNALLFYREKMRNKTSTRVSTLGPLLM